MKTITTDENNDIFLDAAGNLSVSVDLEAVAQTAEHYAATARNEMIHAFDEGIPFFQTVFARDVSIPQFEAALRRRILQSPEVIRIDSLDIFQDGDVLRYNAVIATNYGNRAING